MFLLNKFRYLTVISAVLVFSACASTPKTDFDPNIDFSQYKTFQWQYSEESKSRRVGDPVYDSPLFEKKLEAAVTDLMFDNGFEGSDTPDMYLSYHMADAKRKNYPIDLAVGYGRYSRNSYWNIFAPRISSLQRDEVLVIVDALDANSQELIWRGWAKTRRRSRPHSQNEMIRIADKILAGFPPQ